MTDREGEPKDWAWLLAGCLVAVGLALWLTSGTWGRAPQAGDDVMGHLTVEFL